MDKNTSTATFFSVAAAFAATSFCNAAQADDLAQMRRGQLPKVVPYTAPLQVRVEDRRPRVTYDTPADPQPIYMIPLGLPAPKAAPVVYLPAPNSAGGNIQGGSAGSGMVAPSGYAIVDPGHLPPARLQSNIPAGGTQSARHLPSGTSSNGLGSVSARLHSQNPGQAGNANPAMASGRNSRSVQQMPQVSKYAPISNGANSASGSNTTSQSTSVNGEIIKRFSLINK